MGAVPQDIVEYAGRDLSFGARVGPLSYDLGCIGGPDGGRIVCSWRAAREIILRRRVTPPTFVSYYTVDTPYEEMARDLADSLDGFGLPCELVPKVSQGSWVANTCLKPESIAERWHASDGPVCWLDADSTVAREPWFLYDNPFDFAVVKKLGYHFMSGMVFLNRTEAAGRLLERWTALCRAYPYVWDQALLSHAWHEVSRTTGLKTLWLPDDIFSKPPRGSGLKARLKAFRKDRLYRLHRPALPVFFPQKQASRTQKKAGAEAERFEIGNKGASEAFRKALTECDFSRAFTMREAFPGVKD